MSWWVYLVDPKTEETFSTHPHTEGGTYALGGCGETEVNITYNYSKWYYRHLDDEKGLRWLNEKTAHQTIDRMKHAVQMLGIERSDDYWEGSSGNAGYALRILLDWAEQNPDGKWIVS
jgi:hypothetical protein